MKRFEVPTGNVESAKTLIKSFFHEFKQLQDIFKEHDIYGVPIPLGKYVEDFEEQEKDIIALHILRMAISWFKLQSFTVDGLTFTEIMKKTGKDNNSTMPPFFEHIEKILEGVLKIDKGWQSNKKAHQFIRDNY